ncbi:hypothetical protein [Streptomyces atratus]|uniref:hypothetical protein n=1 Tax=Streptomyces atratus TaxID=1893 RepID=UPI00378E9645
MRSTREWGSLAAADLGRITPAVKRKLKMRQYRPLIDGCLSGTGLVLDRLIRRTFVEGILRPRAPHARGCTPVAPTGPRGGALWESRNQST